MSRLPIHTIHARNSVVVIVVNDCGATLITLITLDTRQEKMMDCSRFLKGESFITK